MRPLHLLLATSALMVACASASGESPQAFPGLPQSEVEAVTRTGTHRFKVWIAANDRSRTLGLMHVRELPPDQGMLFLFARPQPVAFWMKDTWLSLDLIFIGPDGAVLNVAADARPLSLEPIESVGPAIAVLEVLAGTALRIDLRPGDRVIYPAVPADPGRPAPLLTPPGGRTPS